jgi:hypothetical protein
MKLLARTHLAALAVFGLSISAAAMAVARTDDPQARVEPRASQPADAASCRAADRARTAFASLEAMRGPLEAKICKPPLQCVQWGDPPRDHVCVLCQ